jgi:hypothetical protein
MAVFNRLLEQSRELHAFVFCEILFRIFDHLHSDCTDLLFCVGVFCTLFLSYLLRYIDTYCWNTSLRKIVTLFTCRMAVSVKSAYNSSSVLWCKNILPHWKQRTVWKLIIFKNFHMYVLLTVTRIGLTPEITWNQERFSVLLIKHRDLSTYRKVTWHYNLGNGWRWVQSVTLQRLCPCRKNLQLYCVGRNVVSTIGLDVVKKRKFGIPFGNPIPLVLPLACNFIYWCIPAVRNIYLFIISKLCSY